MTNREIIKKHFKKAKENKQAIPAFNFDNLEMLKAIVETANETKTFVLAMATESAAKYMGIEYVNLLKEIAKTTEYVAFHWDHGFDKQLAFNAVKDKWNSVMHDSSKLPMEENIKAAQELKKLALEHDVWVETEIGPIGGKEDDHESNETQTTSLEEAMYFYENAQPDMLAVAVGTAHGLYKGEVKINFDLIEQLNQKISDTFLVLHGGSGIPDELIKKSIRLGITKINFGTELKIAYANGVQKWFNDNPGQFDARKYGRSGIEEVKKVVLNKIKLCKETQ